MGYVVTVRLGPKVERVRAGSLDEALGAAAERLEAAPRRDAVRLRSREFAPVQQVAARAEISGRGVRAGVDIRGDGSAEAWTGRWRRQVVAQERGESAYDALRRVLTA